MSALKAEGSIVGSLAVMTAVYAIYSQGLPSVADIRTAAPGNKDIEATERGAAWMAAGVVAGVSLIAKDPTIFILGGATVIGLSWWTKHANMVNPEHGKAVPDFARPSSVVDAQADADANVYSMGSYETSA
jgi:hypothetical protein